MADPKHLAVLKSGVTAWNRWRKEHPNIIPMLTKAKLFRRQLSGANLAGAQLAEAQLSGAELACANLTRANLSEAKLTYVDLSGTNLTKAHLGEANLDNADLTGATLRGAYLKNASFLQADLSRANLRKADLSGANFAEAYLARASLILANLTGTDLREADLQGAHLHKARFHETILANTNLDGVLGLELCVHHGPSIVDFRTLMKSGLLPLPFLRGCGLSDPLIDSLSFMLKKPIPYYSCFISYSRTDKSFARQLYDQLQGHGIRCWLDERHILPGDNILDQIDEGIRLWDKVLLCCSQTSLTSWWVDGEIDKALQKEDALLTVF